MYKVFATLLAVLAAASAAPPHHQATSFASFNDNHNSIHHHAEAAPAPTLTELHAAVYHHGPAPKYPAPVYAVGTAPFAKVAKYVHAPAYNHHHEDDYSHVPAQYEFAYAIADPHTGDMHSQQEHRDGDHVVGQYSLHEADGTVRIVKYSDDGHGFNAVVEREGHPTEAPVYKKVVAVAAPGYHH